MLLNTIMAKTKLNIIQESGSAIFINTHNLQQNYLYLAQFVNSSKVFPVIKSNAYGLGLIEIASIVHQVGANDFFVATIDEGLALRKSNPTINVYILHGIFKNTERIFVENNLIPVINSISQVKLWNNYGKQINQRLNCIIHIDTGINRLGLRLEELINYWDYTLTTNLNIMLVMSHMACSSNRVSLVNQKQLMAFNKIASQYFKGIPTSIAASYGIFLDKSYHLDVVRPGFALYGSNPIPNQPNPMLPVIEFYSTVLRINHLHKGESLGYDYLYTFTKNAVVATISVGYADGILLNHNPKGNVYINNIPVPIIGKVSMDLIMVDITHIKTLVQEGDVVEIIGSNQDIDAFTQLNNTINCHALNIISKRYPRIYF